MRSRNGKTGPVPPERGGPLCNLMMTKRLILAAFAAVLVLVPHARAADTVPVTISIHATLTGGTLRIHGKTNVPDGAWVIYAAYRAADSMTRVTGYARVKSGRFAAQADVSSWPLGKIAVDADFQVILPARTQPRVVIERYGPKGEHMTGADVVVGGDSYRTAVSSTSLIKRY